MAVNELMPTLYSGVLGAVSRPFAALDVMCECFFRCSRTIRHPPSTAKNIFILACFYDGCAVIRPVGAPARQ